MSISVRLARIGKKNAPTFKVVVSNTKDKRNGKFLDILGHYNPHQKDDMLKIDNERLTYWKGVGANITEAVNKLVDGKYEYIKYNPKGKKESKSE